MPGAGTAEIAAEKKSLHDSERHTPRVRGMRGAYARQLKRVRAGKRVYVDETGATTGMTRLCGRAPPGERVVESVPQGCWKVTTLVGALRRDGPTAALAFDGATDTMAFESFVRENLCPTLRKGDLVVMDRLSAHRDPIVRQLIEAAGARLLYLPPYSPDLNPIEEMWSKVKQHLRSAEARTHDDLVAAMGDALRGVTEADAHGYFAHVGCR
jgi:transposase